MKKRNLNNANYGEVRNRKWTAIFIVAFLAFAFFMPTLGLAYSSKYVSVSGANSETIGKECDAIIERLIIRYGYLYRRRRRAHRRVH